MKIEQKESVFGIIDYVLPNRLRVDDQVLFSISPIGELSIGQVNDYNAAAAKDYVKALVGAVGIEIGILTHIGEAGEIESQQLFVDPEAGYLEYQRLIRDEIEEDSGEDADDMTTEDAEDYYGDMLSNREEASSIRWETHTLGGKPDA